jgi:hypothetical protein
VAATIVLKYTYPESRLPDRADAEITEALGKLQVALHKSNPAVNVSRAGNKVTVSYYLAASSHLVALEFAAHFAQEVSDQLQNSTVLCGPSSVWSQVTVEQ